MLILCALFLFACGGGGENFKIEYYVGDELYHTQTVKSSAEAVLPTAPTKDGYVFDGWYLDNGEWSQLFDINEISGEIKVYAKFSEGSCLHDLTHHGAAAAKCAADGNTEYWSCSDCGKNFSDSEGKTELASVTVKAHGLTHYAAVAADCTTDGNVEYWHCEVCDKNYSDANAENILSTVTVDMLNHLFTVDVDAKAPTCTEVGWDAYAKCERCGEKESYTELPTSHSWMGTRCVACNETREATAGVVYELQDNLQSYIAENIASAKGDVIIAESYNGLPVIALGKEFAHNATGVTSISIPESVKSIGEEAFWDCEDLKSIIIPSGVTVIDRYAFSGCTSLESITIPSGITIVGDYAFDGCSALKYNEYENAYYLGNDTNPYLVLMKAKEGEITSCIVNSNTKVIYQSAFEGCSTLENITIPSGITCVGSDVFVGCTSLSYKEEGNAYYLGNDAEPYFLLWKAKNKEIISCTVNSATKIICSSAFEDCTRLGSITIPKTVITVGNRAFRECTALREVYISDMDAWLKIDFLGSWSANPLYYARSLYLNDNLVTDITVSDNITEIKPRVFNGFKGLESITLSSSVTKIGTGAFERCSNLTEITIPQSVKTIEFSAFYQCTSLNALHISDLEEWIKMSFSDGELNPLRYAKNLYLNGALVTDLTIPSTISKINDFVFYGCTSLESVTIPQSVTSIGSSAFRGCTNLVSITIEGDSLTSIGFGSFDDCRNLTSVYISSIENWLKIEFSCTGDFQSSNPLSNGANLYLNGSLVTDLTVPVGITEIKIGAFVGCTSLESITIPQSVTSIGESVFKGCTKLESITIPSSVNSIGQYVFEGCTALVDIVFEDTSDWYRVTYAVDWENKENGTASDVSDSSANAVYFKEDYLNCYWYKK